MLILRVWPPFAAGANTHVTPNAATPLRSTATMRLIFAVSFVIHGTFSDFLTICRTHTTTALAAKVEVVCISALGAIIASLLLCNVSLPQSTQGQSSPS